MESILPELGVHPKLGHRLQEEKPREWPPLPTPEHNTAPPFSPPPALPQTYHKKLKILLNPFLEESKIYQRWFQMQLFVRNMRTQTQQFQGKGTALIYLAACSGPRLLRQKFLHSSISVEPLWQERVVLIYSAPGWWAVRVWEGGRSPLSPLSLCLQTSQHCLAPSIMMRHGTLIKWQTQVLVNSTLLG